MMVAFIFIIVSELLQAADLLQIILLKLAERIAHMEYIPAVQIINKYTITASALPVPILPMVGHIITTMERI